jgi:hypothetical protein
VQSSARVVNCCVIRRLGVGGETAVTASQLVCLLKFRVAGHAVGTLVFAVSRKALHFRGGVGSVPILWKCVNYGFQ